MKILQYTLGLPPYRRGGLTRYSVDLSETLSEHNRVTVLYPGKMPLWSSPKLHFCERKTRYRFRVIEMENPLPVSLGLGIDSSAPYMEKRDKKNIVSFLKSEKPDVIHIHTLMGLPLEFLEVAKKLNIKLVYTTHDFYGLCPKMLERNPRVALKHRACSYDCMLCGCGPSLKKVFAMQSHVYKYLKESFLVKKIRKNQKKEITNTSSDGLPLLTREVENRYNLRVYYKKMFNLIDMFHYNSNVSKDYVEQFLPRAKGRVVNITHNGIKDNRNNKKCRSNNQSKIIFGYIGPYDEKKGFYELVDTLVKLREDYTNFEFHAYGDILENNIFSNSWAYNHEVLPSSKMSEAYKKIDVLIMPSLWHETFGFSVLEALSYGDVCLVSNTVGAKDLIDPRFIYKDKKEQINILKKICLEPTQILKNEKEYIRNENLPFNFKKHVEKVYKEIYL